MPHPDPADHTSRPASSPTPATQASPDSPVNPAADEPVGAQARINRPARLAARLILSTLVLLVLWYAISDRLVPYSSRATVMAYVAQLAPRVSGQVTEVLAQDNETVSAGDKLFVLDPQPFELAVRQAEINLEQAAQNTSASAASISSAQARVAQEQANQQNTRANTSRIVTLSERGLISAMDADKARADLRTADAKLDAAKAELQSAMLSLGQTGAANNQVRSARLQLEQAQMNLLYSIVAAPTDGAVTNVRLAVGQYITTGNPAMTFIDGRGTWISASFRENQLANINAGDKVSLLFDAIPGHLFSGTVHSIAWGIDPGQPSAGGLVQNQPENHWFEPARRFPVHIELDGGMDNWPPAARAGGKVTVLVFAKGRANPFAWMALGLHRLQSWTSFLY